MRAIAQLLITLGSILRLPFLTSIGQGLNKTALVGDRAADVKRSVGSKTKKSDTDESKKS